jgi:hypothetical protein
LCLTFFCLWRYMFWAHTSYFMFFHLSMIPCNLCILCSFISS